MTTRRRANAAPLLSVLILTIPERAGSFARLVRDVVDQARAYGLGDVEVLALLDDGKRLIGDKRNALLGQARGRFVAWIDDDDEVSPTYVSTLCDQIRATPDVDVVTFRMLRTHPAAPDLLCEFDLHAGGGRQVSDTPPIWQSVPNHLCAWRAELAKLEAFPPCAENWRQDLQWAQAMARAGKSQVKLDATLYNYLMTERGVSGGGRS